MRVTSATVARTSSRDYHAGMLALFGSSQIHTGSAPSVAADVIFRAVTDGRIEQVRYYSSPDGEAIPRAKQLLGQQGYWEKLRAANTTGASDVWKQVTKAPGDVKVETTDPLRHVSTRCRHLVQSDSLSKYHRCRDSRRGRLQ